MDPNRMTEVASYVRHARIQEAALERAAEAMAGRTVWCVSGPALGLPAAQRLEDMLRRLEALGIPGRRRRLPRRGEEEDFAEAIRDSDALVGGALGPDDVVVLEDTRAAPLAMPARERGAHVVWSGAAVPGEEAPSRSSEYLHGQGAAIDAILVTATRRSAGGSSVERVTLAMPSAATVTAIEIAPPPETALLGILADIVRADRIETVGGRRHARPTVAVR
jgi:hypothetical protein